MITIQFYFKNEPVGKPIVFSDLSEIPTAMQGNLYDNWEIIPA